MNILKESQGGEGTALLPGDLERITQLSRKPLTEAEIYTFAVRLCDNEIDRDWERFTPSTLEQLSKLFVGKSGIFDHQWSARGQTARIYKTEVVHEHGRVTRIGDEYCWLKGYAYMLRTNSNHDLIADIEGGIKKEVSVGCRVERAVCSICGADRRQGDCGHQRGQEYGGQLCYTSLEEAQDAYEFSFVAVPAQPMAGVVKSVRGWHGGTSCPKSERELAQLEEEARIGRSYLAQLQQDVVRLALLSSSGLSKEMMESVSRKLSFEELQELAKSFEQRTKERYPVKTQFCYQSGAAERTDGDQAFLV